MEDNRRTFSVTSVINDDPDVEKIEIRITTKADSAKPIDSFVVERAVLKWTAQHIPSWVEYIRNNTMKTL